jgi:hypothetical protein
MTLRFELLALQVDLLGVSVVDPDPVGSGTDPDLDPYMK